MNDWLDCNGYPRLIIGGVVKMVEGRLESREPEPRPDKQPKTSRYSPTSTPCLKTTYYTIYNIAKEHGEHQILKASPYHGELQPIEKILAVVKNMVAYSTTGRMTALELKQMLHGYFSGLERHIFQSVWETSIDIGRQYLLMTLMCPLLNTPTDSPVSSWRWMIRWQRWHSPKPIRWKIPRRC